MITNSFSYLNWRSVHLDYVQSMLVAIYWNPCFPSSYPSSSQELQKENNSEMANSKINSDT